MSWVPLTGLALSRSLRTRKSHVLSMPFFTAMGLAPDVTACQHLSNQHACDSKAWCQLARYEANTPEIFMEQTDHSTLK